MCLEKSEFYNSMQIGGKTNMNICTFFLKKEENHLGLPTLLIYHNL